MPTYDVESSLFSNHANYVKAQISLIEDFALPERKCWPIDWELLKSFEKGKMKKDWSQLPVYRELLQNKSNPAIYFFTVDQAKSASVFELFQQKSEKASIAAIEKGVRHEEFCNYSHLPKTFVPSDCIYVGSRKTNTHERFKQHLGYGSPRTGALHLAKVFESVENIPEVTFHYYILDPKYKKVTEHIECVVQKARNPIIGKKLLND